ncbi:MAG: class I SAM-dependent rRNA methyltransferase [Nitrospinaceae bacterium]
MLKIKVSKTHQARLLKGHPWVHFYQVSNRGVEGQPGDLGVVYDDRNRFLAIGLFDPYSDIRLRVLATREPVTLDAPFFRERLLRARGLRDSLAAENTTGYRVVNGENDGFPGMVVDRYADTVVVKLYTAAWIPFLSVLAPLLEELLEAQRGVLLLSRHVQRTPAEGPASGAILFGPPLEGAVVFTENGLFFQADVVAGQKTGFYLDQRENRARLRELAKDRKVLNVFSYTGGFSVYCLAGGCRSVVEVENNPHALKAAQENLGLNFPQFIQDPKRFRQMPGDAFQTLTRLKGEKERFDLVITDPPAFANHRKHKAKAIQAYLRLARLGAALTSPGGLLFAASCSAPVTADEFFRSVDLGVRQTGRKSRVVFKSRHPKDHPVNFKEGAYLKGICLEIT